MGANTVVLVLTGVIYGAIVVAWAAYLVPLALRRHDEAARSRSIERFSSAMRILARRGTLPTGMPGTTSRVVVTPKRTGKRIVVPELEHPPEQERALVQPPRNRAAERAAAARRRRVLSLILGMFVGVTFVALLGWTPKWAPIVPLLLLASFLVVARLSVRRATKPYLVDLPVSDPEPGVVLRRSPARVEADLGGDRGSKAVGQDFEPEVPISLHQTGSDAVAGHLPADPAALALSAKTADGASLWAPLPVTLPSYVGAPAAVRTFRTIDLGASGARSPERRPSMAGLSADRHGDTRVVRPTPASAGPDSDDRESDEEITEEIPRVVNG